MILNFNIGLLGHVDSGKTSLAQVLSTIDSTASFDKNPQSVDRGITLDLGFSALQVTAPPHLKSECPELEQLQITFVDCPGHASLIRTIIGGAQIIDLMILVIDVQKGLQTQTAECLVIGELLERKLIVALNKIDLLEETRREAMLGQLTAKLRKTLSRTAFGADVPIFNVSAQNKTNIEALLNGIYSSVYVPLRNTEDPLIMYVDHCFSIRGQGTVCTGTLMQGRVAVNDIIEIPALQVQRKVKSIQMFRRPVQSAAVGDRIGLCLTQFNAKLLERGLLTQPDFLKPVYAACIYLERIQYYKLAIKSKQKFHITVAHCTVMATITLFRALGSHHGKSFHVSAEYEYMEQLEAETAAEMTFALLTFETPILATVGNTLIASKLDIDVYSNSCRLAFWGRLQWLSCSRNYADEQLCKFKVFKNKQRQGTVQRLTSDHQAMIVQNLFKKEGNRDAFVGKAVELSTGEVGVIDSTFGQTSKVKITFPDGLKPTTIQTLAAGRPSDVSVLLKYKKYVFNKNMQ